MIYNFAQCIYFVPKSVVNEGKYLFHIFTFTSHILVIKLLHDQRKPCLSEIDYGKYQWANVSLKMANPTANPDATYFWQKNVVQIIAIEKDNNNPFVQFEHQI